MTSKCSNNCPSTEQDKDGDRKCQLCSAVLSNCMECIEDGLKCSVCNQNNVLEQDGLCYPCSSIDANCIKCSDKNTCTECNNPLKLSQNQCLSNCPIKEQDKDGDRKCQLCSAVLSNCIQCTEDGLKCSVCNQNSVLEKDGLCYPCNSIDANCIKCSDKNTCTECKNPLKLSQNKCLPNCPLTEQDSNNDRICKSCNQELNNCLQCSEDGIVCTICEKGFYINSQDQCEICSQNIQNCSICSLNGSECFSCLSPLKLQSNICVDECFRNFYYDAQNICQFCSRKLSNNECKDQCSQFEQDIDQDNICQPCNLIIDNCQKCHEENKTVICDACFNNYELGENECLLCKGIHQDCLKCKQKGICLQCRTLLLSNNTCQAQCDDTEQDYDNDQVCQPCSQQLQNCSKCNQQSKQCFEYQRGFFLDNDNQCKQCSEINPSCIQCSNSTECTLCSGQKLSQGNCVEQCPQTEQDQSNSGVCSSCSQVIDNCSECNDNGSLCFSCIFPYILTESNSCDSKTTQEESEKEQSNQEKVEGMKRSIDIFNITSSEKEAIKTISQVQDTTKLVGISSEAAVNLVPPQNGSTGNIFTLLLADELLHSNAQINVQKPEILQAYYYQMNQNLMNELSKHLNLDFDLNPFQNDLLEMSK